MSFVTDPRTGLQLLELTQKLLPDVIVMEMVLSGLVRRPTRGRRM